MSIQNIPASEVSSRLSRGEKIDLIDVRTPVEFAEVHAIGARCVPLNRLDVAKVIAERGNAGGGPICLICKAGTRAAKAAQKFADAGFPEVLTIAGGTDAWVSAGLPVERNPRVMSLERQVRIAAGTLVLAGAVLALTVHPGWVYLSAFVGAGLIFAGITNFCGMGMLIARMPWNRGGPCGK